MATERDYFHDLAEDLVHGAEESYVADLSEEMLDLLEQGMASEDRWAVMAMRCREAAMGVWARHTGAVTSQCERAFTRALSREDEAIVSSLASEFSAPTGLTNRAANEVMEASRGLAEIISRQNVALADNLADTWWRVTADAVTRTQMGDDPRDVMEDAVSFLSRAGLETIDYRSGQRTSIDAAVRRHTVTQANQCRNDMLVRQCEAYEVDLVFTSAHWGCRPTHAEWQGKPFSLHGTVEVDGVVYRDLAEATGYGTVQGLCGANCRHRLTPYVPGLSKLPDTDFSEFEKKYHMTSEEYYRATQRQRALERQVRATKREIALGQERGLDMTEARYRLGAQQKRLREHCAMTGLPRDGERERAYGVREQPRALSSRTGQEAIKANQAAMRARRAEAFSQDFGDSVADIRAAYSSAEDVATEFKARTGVHTSFDTWFSSLPRKRQEAIATGLEYGISFVGEQARALTDVVGRKLEKDTFAQNVRRETGYVIEISRAEARRLTLEQLEQVSFHEVAHSAEHALTTWQEHMRERDQLLRFASGRSTHLQASTLSGIMETELRSAGYSSFYSDWNGRIMLEDAGPIASQISPYAVRDAARGTQDSELAAESIRFVANRGYGENAVADVVARRLL